MNTHNRIDRLDEALRMLFLESSNTNLDAEQTLAAITSGNYTAEMRADKKQLLMNRLQDVLMSASLGQLLENAIRKAGIQAQTLEQQTGVPETMIRDLQQDNIYPNNVPVVLFRKLLSALKISFESAERAIRQTFEMLQVQAGATIQAGLAPAFKKGQFADTPSLYKSSMPSDGKELFQSEEALNRYLNKLDELMHA